MHAHTHSLSPSKWPSIHDTIITLDKLLDEGKEMHLTGSYHQRQWQNSQGLVSPSANEMPDRLCSAGSSLTTADRSIAIPISSPNPQKTGMITITIKAGLQRFHRNTLHDTLIMPADHFEWMKPPVNRIGLVWAESRFEPWQWDWSQHFVLFSLPGLWD